MRRNFCVAVALLVPITLAGIAMAQERSTVGDPPASLKAFCESHQGQYFYGIYALGGKVGWMSESARLENTDRGEIMTHQDLGKIRLRMFGVEKSMEYESKSQYSLTGDGSLTYAEEATVDGESKSTATAEARPGGFRVVLQSEGQERRLDVGPSQDTLRALQELEVWLHDDRQAGDTIKRYTFDFDHLGNVAIDSDGVTPDEEEIVTFVKRCAARWGGVPVMLTEAKWKMGSINANVELLPDGTPLSFSYGPLNVRLEEEQIAKNLDLVVADMLAFVPVDEDLGSPEKVRKAVVELRGLGDLQIPQSPRQQVIEAKPGFALLKLDSQAHSDTSTPLSPEEIAAFTAATLRIQSDHQQIVKLARELVGDESQLLKQSDLLQDWIFNNVQGTYAQNADTSLRVLENLAGDCTENALLFVALARALHIPAREVGGLIYSNDPKTGFYWHAWAEIHDGDQWIGVDPAFHETQIDAAHILMDQDISEFASVSVMGKLKIRVRDFETAK